MILKLKRNSCLSSNARRYGQMHRYALQTKIVQCWPKNALERVTGGGGGRGGFQHFLGPFLSAKGPIFKCLSI